MCLSTMKYLLRLCSKVTGKCICASCYKFIVSIKYKDISYNFLRIHIQFRKGICLELERQLVTSQRSTTRKEGGKKNIPVQNVELSPKTRIPQSCMADKTLCYFFNLI